VTRGAGAGVVVSEEGHRVTTLELFFDLAFVFAFTQLSRLMADRHDALGVLQALIILALLWWSWTAYSWLANLTHADAGIVRIAMIVATTAMFVVGLVVLEAHVDRPGGLFAPLVFVGGYLVARITHAIVFNVVTWKSNPSLRRATLLTSALSVIPSGVLLTLGAVVGGMLQIWLGLAAVALEPLVASRTSAGIDWPVRSVAHFTERHGLVVILALGESIIAVGVGVAAEPMSGPILAGVVLAMAITVCLWWSYFAELAGSAEHALTHSHGANRGRVATEGYTYLHLAVVAGIVLAALGLEVSTAHVGESAALGVFGAAALGGGVACHLAGTALFARRVIGTWRGSRLLGAGLLLGLVPLLAAVPPIIAMSIVVGTQVTQLLVEGVMERRAHGAADSRATSPAAPRHASLTASPYVSDVDHLGSSMVDHRGDAGDPVQVGRRVLSVRRGG
jgi:low temperature requirement protein LtrA